MANYYYCLPLISRFPSLNDKYKVFCTWEYMLENPEMSQNRTYILQMPQKAFEGCTFDFETFQDFRAYTLTCKIPCKFTCRSVTELQ